MGLQCFPSGKGRGSCAKHQAGPLSTCLSPRVPRALQAAPAAGAEAGAASEAGKTEAEVAPGDRDELWADLWTHGPLETIDAGQFYRVIGRTGINYGPTFRMVKRVATSDAEGMLRCACSHGLSHRTRGDPGIYIGEEVWTLLHVMSVIWSVP